MSSDHGCSECNVCGDYKPRASFVSKTGRMLLTCLDCRNNAKTYRDAKKGYMTKWLDANPLYMMINNTKHSDKINGLDKRTPDYEANVIDEAYIKELIIKQENRCIYDGVSMTQRTGQQCPTTLTAERIDNSLSHVKSNVVLACSRCNCRRSNHMSHDAFKTLVTVEAAVMAGKIKIEEAVKILAPFIQK